MEFIGIDIGTTSICGIRIDGQTGVLLSSKTVNSDAFLMGAYPFEKIQSVPKIIHLAQELLDSLITDDTKAIGITGQMHGIVYINSQGEAISPLYTWQDGRGDQPYRDTTYAEHLGSYSGYGNVTDFYNRENGLRPQGTACYTTIHDYFVMVLTGRKSPLMHASNAASFGLYDLRGGKWNYELDVETVRGYDIAGRYRGIPVSVAIGDNQASVFSTLADDKSVLINVGTGSQVSVITDHIITAENVETRPYFEGKYLVVGAALCGGRAYSLLKSFYAEIIRQVKDTEDSEIYAMMDRMLSENTQSALRVDTRFAGTRQNPAVRGSILNVGADSFNPSALTRGVLYGIVEELYGMYQSMNVSSSFAVASGNGIRKNPHLLKIAEEIFGMRISVPSHLEEAAFGAALFGAISGGFYENAVDAQKRIQYL